MNIAIVYHDADFDGKLSNEACRYWLNTLNPEANIHSYGWDYGKPVPSWTPKDALGMSIEVNWEYYDQIYIVDLSVDELMARPELRNKIVWIDHHKSAIDKWDHIGDANKMVGYRIDGVAACRLCWQWFAFERGPHGDPRTHPSDVYTPNKQDFITRTVSEPELIRLAGEYDVWDHREPDAKALQFGLRALSDKDYRILVESQFAGPSRDYAGYGTTPLVSTLANGYAIKSYCDRQNDEYAAKHAHTIQWEGLTFCALNTSGRSSDHFDGALKTKHDACFCWRFDGRVVSVSLYSVPGKDIDLSLIATKYGGGGHRGACGFRTTLEKLATILALK